MTSTDRDEARPSALVLYARATAYAIFQAFTVLLYATLGTAVSVFLPFRLRYRLMRTWADLNTWFLVHVVCLRYRVCGLEHIPDQPSVVMANHQSAWETIVLPRFLPPLTWVLKRELLWIPFFGWGLASVEPIAIDRRVGRAALRQLLDTGSRRLRTGRWVMVFPQGTRMPPGDLGRFKPGGALLATRTGVPVVPVAHNAGRFWGRHQFLKYPGVVHVEFGPPVETLHKTPEQVIGEVRAWIGETLARIDPPPR